MKETVERKEEEEVSVGGHSSLIVVSLENLLLAFLLFLMCSPSLLICLSLSLLDLPEEMQQR